MKRKLFSGLLALILTLGLGFGVLSADVKFTDVKEKDWFYKDVKIAVEKDLVNGKSDTIFAPYDRLTYAEAVKLAACMHQRQHLGKVTLQNGSPWYQPYVDYCKDKKIIDRNYPWNLDATRAEYMEIFSRALPESELKKINEVPDNAVPDVPASHPLAKGIYKLYRAGIVNGVDAARSCKPDANITRAEVAAILTRMMDKDERVKFSLGAAPAPTPTPSPDSPKEFKIITQPVTVTVNAGETGKFTVEAQGEGLQYQWERYNGTNFVAIPESLDHTGTKTAELSIRTALDEEGALLIRCRLKDKNGKQLNSATAHLKILPVNVDLKLTQDLDEETLTVKPNETVTFGIRAVGKGLKYKWSMVDPIGVSVPLPFAIGQGSDTLTIRIPKIAPMETYKIRCEVTDENNKKVVTKDKPIFVESYIKEILFISNSSLEKLNVHANSIESNEFYRVIRVDLNKGTGGDCMYACVEQTGNIDEAITDVFVRTNDPGASFPLQGEFDHYGRSWFHRCNFNLNSGIDSKIIYLYKTYDKGGNRHPMTHLNVLVSGAAHDGFNYNDYEVAKLENSSVNANLNEGTAGNYLYFIMKRK
ncbi:MAG: S-layer homology domain-containing protein [Bacillota bacterium]|nr:S-layer homology domain-containing protein [Bacillota bacterium]